MNMYGNWDMIKTKQTTETKTLAQDECCNCHTPEDTLLYIPQFCFQIAGSRGKNQHTECLHLYRTAMSNSLFIHYSHRLCLSLGRGEMSLFYISPGVCRTDLTQAVFLYSSLRSLSRNVLIINLKLKLLQIVLNFIPILFPTFGSKFQPDINYILVCVLM